MGYVSNLTVAADNDSVIGALRLSTEVRTIFTTLAITLGANAADTFEYSMGLRFVNVPVTRRARIVSASFGVTASVGGGATSNILSNIFGELTANPPTFDLTQADWDARPLTVAVVPFNHESVNNALEVTNSPDIADIIQEIVNQSGWEVGNAIVIMWLDNNSLANQQRHDYTFAGPFGGGAATAPTLQIEWVPRGGNQRPRIAKRLMTP